MRAFKKGSDQTRLWGLGFRGEAGLVQLLGLRLWGPGVRQSSDRRWGTCHPD